jgi:hypothetical protein
MASAPLLQKNTRSANEAAHSRSASRSWPEQVGRVPDFAGLLGQCGDQPRVGMAECRNGDATGKIQIAFAFGGEEPNAFAALEHEVLAGIGWQYGRRCGHGQKPSSKSKCRQNAVAASKLLIRRSSTKSQSCVPIPAMRRQAPGSRDSGPFAKGYVKPT